MSEWCFKGVLRASQGYSTKGVLRMFKRCSKDVLKMFSECFKVVPRVFQKSFKGVSGDVLTVFQGSVKGVLMFQVFQSYFKTV